MPHTLKQKLFLKLGQKVSSIQRNYPYPIKKKILNFSPISIPKSEKRMLAVFITHKQIYEGLWAAWSWMRFLNRYGFALSIFIDGEVTPKIAQTYEQLLPGCQVISGPKYLSSCDLPEDFKAYGLQHRFGRIHTIRLELQKKYELLYSDSDILVFQKPREILERLETDHKPLFNSDSLSPIDDPWVVEKLQKHGLGLMPLFNAGLLYIPQGSLDAELGYEILKGWSKIPKESRGHHTGQTLFNALMKQADAEPLPPTRYLCNNEGMWFWKKDYTNYNQIVTRHFVGNVRHQMYIRGMPYLYNQVKNQ